MEAAHAAEMQALAEQNNALQARKDAAHAARIQALQQQINAARHQNSPLGPN